MEHITRQSKIILSLLWLVTPIRKIKINQWKQTVTGASSDKVPTLTAGPNKKDAKSDFTEDVTIGYSADYPMISKRNICFCHI